MSRHLLIFDYPKNKDTVQHSIIFFCGSVQNYTKECEYTTYLSVKLPGRKDSLRVLINPKTNRFNCVIELQPGNNSLLVTYCCISTNFLIKYKERNSNLQVLPVYIICKNDSGSFQAPSNKSNKIENACKRITLGCKLLQAIFGLKLNTYKCFILDKRGCVVFYSNLASAQAYQMNKLELWQYFAREIIQSDIGNANIKYIAFLSCTKYKGNSVDNKNYKDLISQTDGYVAFGGEALALLGTACLYIWPENLWEVEGCFKDETPVDSTIFLDDSCYRGTLGGCFATSLGAALHELCHTFDLGHDKGIMGLGFNNIQQLFLSDYNPHHAESLDAFWPKNQLILLNYHRWFNDYPEDKRKCILQFDITMKLVKSTAGIRVVELRQGTDEQVIASWVFDGFVLKYSYQINYAVKKDVDIMVVVEDNDGHVLKTPFYRDK